MRWESIDSPRRWGFRPLENRGGFLRPVPVCNAVIRACRKELGNMTQPHLVHACCFKVGHSETTFRRYASETFAGPRYVALEHEQNDSARLDSWWSKWKCCSKGVSWPSRERIARALSPSYRRVVIHPVQVTENTGPEASYRCRVCIILSCKYGSTFPPDTACTVHD